MSAPTDTPAVPETSPRTRRARALFREWEQVRVGRACTGRFLDQVETCLHRHPNPTERVDLDQLAASCRRWIADLEHEAVELFDELARLGTDRGDCQQ